MSELIRDPAWQAIGAIIGVIAACVIYILQKQHKELSYKVISIERLLTINEELEGRLQVLYDGEPARDITLIRFQLINSGTIPIATRDYEEPISLSTGHYSKILSTVVTKIEPSNLPVKVDLQCSNLIRIEPVLLNSKDSITLKILVRDFCGTISPTSRIIGVKGIKPIAGPSSRAAMIIYGVTLGLVLGSVYIRIFHGWTSIFTSVTNGLAVVILIIAILDSKWPVVETLIKKVYDS